jgi:hypothetical protein
MFWLSAESLKVLEDEAELPNPTTTFPVTLTAAPLEFSACTVIALDVAPGAILTAALVM